MLIVYMILWFIFNERVTLELAVIGLIVCGAVDLFSWKILGAQRRKKAAAYMRLIGGGARYGCNLLREIFRCNAAVIRLILSPSLEVEPELHTFTTRLKTDTARVALANSITLTPGTITCTLEGDKFCVHALDSTLGEGVESSDFEKRLLELEAISDDAQ
ncbi:MAG: Na+/H+ antiporter subunit E [Clostridia bacterium]|nr:Na+/H+ antiporter subunit E [Clostridia bacterium]